MKERLDTLLTAARRHQLLAVGASAALAIALLAGRMVHVRSHAFAFLAWNLILAFIPWSVSFFATSVKSEWRWLLLPVWLVFFPNAPYLVTDFVHLRSRPPVPVWYDVGMLTSFAWAGLLCAVTSLGAVHSEVERSAGRAAGWLFVAGVSSLTGYGIYLGRFLRKNSWDVLLDPLDLARTLASPLLNPAEQFRTFVVAALFGSLMLVVYGAFRTRPTAP
ncbi:MAG: DUF1361 domain-containing protein [Myxococcales bacterium]|nr:DUF1361 domain-containing protein [Myxococcales bacterium]MCB9577915.1 DUF1361 domain-containing protein [Polyangiaceae bacterium]